jgi:CDP-4-dehydro-6-deoxyglucose reductase, E3
MGCHATRKALEIEAEMRSVPSLPSTFEARLVRVRTLTPSVRELVFARVDEQPMEFAPGQWVNVLLGDESAQEMKRSYSIASAPDGSPRFELAVTRVQGGPASTLLHAIEPGAVLRFAGAHGFFTRPAAEATAPALMIATGTGVTPMRSMVRAAIADRVRGTVWLVLGVRHEEDLLYEDEFRALAEEHPFFRFEPTLSQPREAWTGRRGYVQTHVRDLWAELSARGEGVAHAYVCGLERMVGSVRDILRKEMGLPRQQVHSERYD